MKHPASAVLAALLFYIAPISTCFGAEPPSAASKPTDQAGDVFARMAQATAEELKSSALFEGFEYEIVVVKPFVVVMTREPGEDPAKTAGRKARIEGLARGIWQNWLKVRTNWELLSTRKDTLENPEPFVWTAFHSEDAYNQYMKKAKTDGKYTPGSQAFYSTTTRHVSFYDDPKRDPAIIIIHETFHQLMDRFSEVSSVQYQSYFFTEGLPEYFAGYRGEGEAMVLGELTRTRRMEEIQEIRKHFNDGKTLCYPNAERKLQVTPDDWIFFDVPMLLTLRDKMWVRAISRALVEQFKRSKYVEDSFCKEFVDGGEVSFHSSFYAYAWAFTYWLNKNYPDAYRRYAMAVLNTKDGGDAEVFLKAFAIQPARPLPDILSIVGPENRDVAKNMQKAVTCLDERIAILRQTPEIQDMHRQWAEWMRNNFAKPSAAVVATSPLSNLADEPHPAIDRVILKGDAPQMVYVPIIHDDEFSRHSADGMKGVTEVMARCEEIADGLYHGYGLRNLILEGVPKTFADSYNRVPLEKRKPAPANGSGTIVHNTWSRVLAGKQWVLLPAADKPIVAPLTALGREYDARIVAVLDEAKKSGWMQSAAALTENQTKLNASLAAVAAEYNTKRRAILDEDPGLKKEYAITVTDRNKSFLDNLLASESPGLAFFGAGHWPDIEKQLEERKVSYAVVVPKGVPWPPTKKDDATIEADMLKLGAKLRKATLKLGDGASAEVTIPIE